MRVMTIVAVAGAALVAGCASAGLRAPESAGHDVITQQELERAQAPSLYEAVYRLRPSFFRNRAQHAHGLPATAPLMLYVNGDRMESVNDLRQYSVAEVLEVRFYEPQIANVRFGQHNNAAGAISVTLRRP